MAMKKYSLGLLALLLFLLCVILAACDSASPEAPTDTAAESVTDALTDAPTGSPTEAPTETPSEETTEESTEAPTEPETEPEELVSAKAPPKVLESLTADFSVLDISSVSKQVTLRNTDIDSAKNAFIEEGYIVAATTAAYGSTLNATVLKSRGHAVTLMQTADGSLHVVWEKASEVSTDPLYSPRGEQQGEVVMAQIGIAREDKDDNPMIGMCYVYRLADGSALIIDGGVNNDSCAENLYRALGKLDIAKDEDGKYRITAWIFTHGHSDHMGTFKAFSSTYAEKTALTYAVFNFPTEDVAPSGSTQDGSFYNVIRRAYPTVKRVTPHAGLTYFFGNLSVHMLYAPELVYTSPEGVDYYNTTSLLFRVEANGQSILHMGDASEASSKAAWTENDSSAFQSTAIQITHHGLYTGADGSHTWNYMRKIYHATNASIGLLPMGTRKPGDSRNGRHTVLVGWGMAGYQVSFVIDKKDNRNGASTDQAYFDRFAADVAAGTADRETLFGYNGINTIDNGKGLLTYINATETEPMATVFSLTTEGMTVTANEELAKWLGQ